MEHQPLVSVIVPVYNTERYLSLCLTSIVNQTYRNLEILLINDGSTDGSEAVCRQFMAKDPRIQLFCQENQGQSAARNLGLDHMTGKYLMFVDSDDYIDPAMVELLLNCILTHEADIAVCDYVKIGEAEAKLGPATPLEAVSGQSMNRDEVYGVICRTAAPDRPSRVRFLILPCKLYAAELFQALRLPVGRVCEDEYMVHLMYDRVERIYCIDQILYYYVQTQTSTMRRNGVRIFQKDAIWALTERLKYLQGYGNRSFIRDTAFEILTHTKDFYEQSGASPQDVKRHMSEKVAEIRQITGRTFFFPKCFLYMLFPSLYCRLRSCYRKLRGRAST